MVYQDLRRLMGLESLLHPFHTPETLGVQADDGIGRLYPPQDCIRLGVEPHHPSGAAFIRDERQEAGHRVRNDEAYILASPFQPSGHRRGTPYRVSVGPCMGDDGDSAGILEHLSEPDDLFFG